MWFPGTVSVTDLIHSAIGFAVSIGRRGALSLHPPHTIIAACGSQERIWTPNEQRRSMPR